MRDTDTSGWQDRELGTVVFGGVVLGVPLMFLVAATMVVLGHVAIGTAMAVALVPAVFIGPYVGGLVLLGRASARHEPGAVSRSDTGRSPGGPATGT